ncbi:rRNA maturation RNase YbeY [soil metagenome]
MISFNNEDITFTLKNKTKLKNWIVSTIEKKKKIVGDISFTFCSDAFLLEMNKAYLNHDTYTDIITFDYSKEDERFSLLDSARSDKLEVTAQRSKSKTTKTSTPISGDIFISIDRVRENATKLSLSFEEELHRVIIHGVLHLLGYKDKSKIAKAEMRKQEDLCLKALAKY